MMSREHRRPCVVPKTLTSDRLERYWTAEALGASSLVKRIPAVAFVSVVAWASRGTCC